MLSSPGSICSYRIRSFNFTIASYQQVLEFQKFLAWNRFSRPGFCPYLSERFWAYGCFMSMIPQCVRVHLGHTLDAVYQILFSRVHITVCLMSGQSSDNLWATFWKMPEKDARTYFNDFVPWVDLRMVGFLIGGKVFLIDGTGAWGNPTPKNIAYGATKRALTQLKVRTFLKGVFLLK